MKKEFIDDIEVKGQNMEDKFAVVEFSGGKQLRDIYNKMGGAELANLSVKLKDLENFLNRHKLKINEIILGCTDVGSSQF